MPVARASSGEMPGQACLGGAGRYPGGLPTSRGNVRFLVFAELTMARGWPTMPSMLHRSLFALLARRLLALWVLVSLLGYGSAWAMDLHEALSPMQASGQFADVTTAVLPADRQHAPERAPDCDHCCHGLSHLLGLSVSLSCVVPAASVSNGALLSVVFMSRFPAPDLRPPIA